MKISHPRVPSALFAVLLQFKSFQRAITETTKWSSFKTTSINRAFNAKSGPNLSKMDTLDDSQVDMHTVVDLSYLLILKRNKSSQVLLFNPISLNLKIFHCILNNLFDVPEYFFMGLTIGEVGEREKQRFIMEKQFFQCSIEFVVDAWKELFALSFQFRRCMLHRIATPSS